ncbi:MAG: Crp/Fnr family transcriptional regulator [Terracidiphilus sp.]|jgi:CRP-like cAMP-binding protein
MKDFDAREYLRTQGRGRKLIHVKPKMDFFVQGEPATDIFHIQSGRAKLTVISKKGKEATVTLLVAGDFFGEEALSAEWAHRTVTATALTHCDALRISREELRRVMNEHTFAAIFTDFIVKRGIRAQADLIDQLFNSSERRLARILLLMADFGKPSEPATDIPPVTQETLAEMIGTTRSRVSFFMNRFRKLGYIEYNGHLHINKQLLNVVLDDNLPEQNASRPAPLDPKAGTYSIDRLVRRRVTF